MTASKMLVHFQLLTKIQTQGPNSSQEKFPCCREGGGGFITRTELQSFCTTASVSHVSPKPASRGQTSRNCVFVISRERIVSRRVLLHLLLSTFQSVAAFVQFMTAFASAGPVFVKMCGRCCVRNFVLQLCAAVCGEIVLC